MRLLSLHDGGTVIGEVKLDNEVHHLKLGRNNSTTGNENFCVATTRHSPYSVSVVNLDTLSVVARINIDETITAVSTPRYDRLAFGLLGGEISVWKLDSEEFIGNYSVGHPSW